MRITGISSGMDVDGMVKKLMEAENVKADSVRQSKTKTEWKRDAYREITNMLIGFKNSFMDVLSPTNLCSSATFNKYSTTITDILGNASNEVTVLAGAGATAGSHSITVSKIATAEQLKGGELDKVSILGTTAVTNESFVKANGKSIVLNVDGVEKTITIKAGVDLADSIKNLNASINSSFGSGKVVAGTDASGKLKIPLDVNVDTTTKKISIKAGSTDNPLGDLGFDANSKMSTNISNSDSLERLNVGDSGLNFSINGKKFNFTKKDTVGSVISAINSDSTANVTIKFDELSNRFTITAKELGAGDKIKIEGQGEGAKAEARAKKFKTAFGFNQTEIVPGDHKAAVLTAGTNASVTIDGNTLDLNSNTFTLNDITYTLNKASGKEQIVKTSQDSDKVYENISKFVTQYNDLVDKINKELLEPSYRSYAPLTDAQKKEMTEQDIKKWEEKAQSGLLKKDSLLSGMLSKMRSALYENVKDAGLLASVGITTTTNWRDRGKLVIDQNKLKSAIQNEPDKVMKIFTNESSTPYSPDATADGKYIRNKENGIMNRLNDILQDYTRTGRNTAGRKGLLLEKAGITKDGSDTSNELSKIIYEKDKSLDKLIQMLAIKEASYYKQFTAMEKALANMNSQSAWISQQLG